MFAKAYFAAATPPGPAPMIAIFRMLGVASDPISFDTISHGELLC